MSEVEWERGYPDALALLAEDERVRDENVWVNFTHPAEPRYLLLAVAYRDAASYAAVLEPYRKRGFVPAMPYGELAYYAKIVRPGMTADEVDGVVQAYLDSDAWPE